MIAANQGIGIGAGLPQRNVSMSLRQHFFEIRVRVVCSRGIGHHNGVRLFWVNRTDYDVRGLHLATCGRLEFFCPLRSCIQASPG